MKDSTFTTLLVFACAMMLAASEPSTVTSLPAKLSIFERQELQTEIPQPDGMTKKQVWVTYEDRVLQCTFNGELISATNTVNTGRAIVKLVPEDARRVR